MSKLKALIVEDEEGINECLQSFLRRLGFDTIGTASGKEAVNLYEEHCPDLCILDIFLVEPDFNGINVLEGIKNINQDACCIMLTCCTDHKVIQAAKDLGAIDYINKPFNTEEFLEKVKEIKSKIEAGV